MLWHTFMYTRKLTVLRVFPSMPLKCCDARQKESCCVKVKKFFEADGESMKKRTVKKTCVFSFVLANVSAKILCCVWFCNITSSKKSLEL